MEKYLGNFLFSVLLKRKLRWNFRIFLDLILYLGVMLIIVDDLSKDVEFVFCKGWSYYVCFVFRFGVFINGWDYV